MSLSDSKKDPAFKDASWGADTLTSNDKQESRGVDDNDGEGFKTLYSNKDRKGPDGFVASYVSEEKARAIQKNKNSANTTKTQDPQEVRRQAYEEAFEKGHQAGLEEGRRRSRDIIERLESIASQIESVWTNLIETHESRIIELVARAVEKVVYGQAALDQEMVKRAIIEALRVVPEPVNVQISVNPKDYEYIETVKEDFFAHIKALKDVSVTPDPAVHQGGCNVRTRFGEVDATLESRLEAIRECLLRANGKKTGLE